MSWAVPLKETSGLCDRSHVLSWLYVQISDTLGVRLNKCPPRWNIRPHQHIKREVSGGGIVDRDLQEGAVFWIHRGFPQLARVHLAQTLITLHFRVPTKVFDDFIALGLVVCVDLLLVTLNQ